MAFVRSVRGFCVARLVLVLLSVPHAADANPESARLRARGYEYALNLDYDEATRDTPPSRRTRAIPRPNGASHPLPGC
jgi:hypothetical protein